MGMRYKNAPIVEAVIEFRVTAREGLSLDDVARAHSGEEIRYPLTQKRMNYEGELTLSEEGVTTEGNQTQVGYVYVSEDRRKLFHSTREGFIFSKLAPYSSWEEFSAEAWRLWQRYVESTKPEQVDWIGVRYINRIRVPYQQIEIKDYLRTYPELSSDLPQLFSGFFFQVQVPFQDRGIQTTITSAMEGEIESVSLILDIDCRKGVGIAVSDTSLESDARLVLEELRRSKNNVFEACITDQTRRLINDADGG